MKLMPGKLTIKRKKADSEESAFEGFFKTSVRV